MKSRVREGAGRTLMLARLSRGLTRSQAAAQLGINDHTLRSLEASPGGAKFDNVVKAMHVYKLSLKDICR